MTTTAEVCKKFSLPLPPSVWKRAGLEVPEQQMVASGRIVDTVPGFQPAEHSQQPETEHTKQAPVPDITWRTDPNGNSQADVMPDDMAGLVRQHRDDNKPVERGLGTVNMVVSYGDKIQEYRMVDGETVHTDERTRVQSIMPGE